MYCGVPYALCSLNVALLSSYALSIWCCLVIVFSESGVPYFRCNCKDGLILNLIIQENVLINVYEKCVHYYSCIFARLHLKDANLSTEVKSTAQRQGMDRFTLIVGYELCSSLNTLYNEEIRHSRSASGALIYMSTLL
jgi:hypothetical protein